MSSRDNQLAGGGKSPNAGKGGCGQVAQQSTRKGGRTSQQRKKRKRQHILAAVGANPGGGDSQGVGELYGTLEENSFQDQDLS